MGNGLVAFAAGLGSGYLGAQQRTKEQERLDKLDAQAAELHNARMDDIRRVNSDRVALGEAGKLATVSPEGATLGLANGTKTVYDDSGVANSDFRQLRAADQATGNQTLARVPLPSLADGQVPQDTGPRIAGDRSMILPPGPSLADGQLPKTAQVATPMASLADNQIAPGENPSTVDGEHPSEPKQSLASLSLGNTMPQAPQRAATLNGKAYPSLADAKAAATALNAPDSLIARQAAAYRAAGQPEKAMQLEANSKQARLADYQLSTAQTNHLNELANQKIQERAAANGGNWFNTQADILTETGVGGLSGAKAVPRPSADGKTMQIVLTRPDGTEQVVKQYANNDAGQMRAQQDLMQVNPTVKMQWLHERATTDQTQSNFDRTHTETERHNAETESATKTKVQMEFDPLGLNLPPTGSGRTGAGTTSHVPGIGSNGTGTTAQAIASGVKGPELLKALPGPLADQIKALADGRMAFPAGFALKTPYWQSMISLTAQYDPSFDAVNYNARVSTRKDFTSGKSAQSANALNTVMGHLESLSTAADALSNTSYPLLNKLGNAAASSLGDPRIKKFDATKKAVVDELTRAWRGSGGSEADIKTWAGTLDAADSPQQLHGVIGQLGELLESKIGALNEQYSKGMGTTENGLQLMSPHASQVLQKIRKRAGIDTPSQNAGTSAPTAGQESNAPSKLPRVATPAEAMKLAPGTIFVDANGVTRKR